MLLIKQAHKLPRARSKSLTWDRGCEMAQHKRFSLATDVKVYFCDPNSLGSVARTKTSGAHLPTPRGWVCAIPHCAMKDRNGGKTSNDACTSGTNAQRL